MLNIDFRRVGAVLRKEILDAARDKRSIWSLVFSAVFGPVLISFMLSNIAARQRGADDIKIPVVGAEHAPAFVDWLKQQAGVEVIAGPADAEQAVRDRKEDVVLIIDKDFSKNFARSIPAGIKMVSDGSRDTARPKVRRVRTLVQGYSAGIGELRLIARGVSPRVSAAVKLEDVEVSSAQQRAAVVLGFLPMFLVIGAFAGSLQIAMDSTAGERERGSLEPLLLNPVTRETFAVGKWLAAAIGGALSVLLSAILCTAALQRVPLHDLGARFRLGPAEAGVMVAIVLPMTLMFSGLVMSVAMFARSYKEAQSYIGMLMLVPMLPGIVSSIYPLTGRPYLAPIPVIGHYSLTNDVLGGNPPALHWVAISILATIVVSILLVKFTARQMTREKIIFGK